MPNNRALKGVREQRGLGIAAVADFAAISADRLTEFEAGDRTPSRKQMEKLADTYGVPLYSLFADGISNLPELPKDFRKSDPSPAALTPRGMRTLWSSEQISHFTFQLATELRYVSADLALSARTADTPKKAAHELRKAFDKWLAPREASLAFSGTPEQKFLGALRLFFEIQGGVLNVNEAPTDDFMGFYLAPEGGLPTIFVNRTIQSKKAQLFTLAHEYAHFLLGRDGISDPYKIRNDIERRCNIFAAEFLAPMAAFKRLVELAPATTRSDPSSLIAGVSQRTLLSNHAAAIRLAEAGYISQVQLRTWVSLRSRNLRIEKDEETAASAASAGGQPHAKRLGELGYLPVYLANRAVSANIIDKYDVAAGIGLSETLQQKAYSLAIRRFDAALS